MSIDDFLGDRHRDQLLTTSEELTLIEREINKRRLIGAEIHVRLFERLQAVDAELLCLQPEHAHAPDVQRLTRAPLEQRRAAILQQIDEELTGRWRDLQQLEAERRRLGREQREEVQRYERHTGTYDR